MTGENFRRFSDTTGSPCAQPWRHANACPYGCARGLWKSLTVQWEWPVHVHHYNESLITGNWTVCSIFCSTLLEWCWWARYAASSSREGHCGLVAALPRSHGLSNFSEPCVHYNIQSRGFETSRDLTIRRLSVEAQGPPKCTHDIPLIILHNIALRPLTHWGQVTHICVSKLTIIGSDNGMSPGRRQAIIWTNAGVLSIGPVGTNFSEILFEIYTFSFKKMHLNMSSGKWRPFCLGLNVLNSVYSVEVERSATHWFLCYWWVRPFTAMTSCETALSPTTLRLTANMCRLRGVSLWERFTWDFGLSNFLYISHWFLIIQHQIIEWQWRFLYAMRLWHVQCVVITFIRNWISGIILLWNHTDGYLNTLWNAAELRFR